MQHLVGHFTRRVTDENSPRNGELDDGDDSESDDGSEAPDSPRSSPEGEEADAFMGEGTDRASLNPDARRALAAIIIRLASRAQYSKARATPNRDCYDKIDFVAMVDWLMVDWLII